MPPSTSKYRGIVLPRIDTSSSPIFVASASPPALSRSVTTRMRPPISGTSAYGKQWPMEIDSTRPLPSMALTLSTNARMSGSVVG